MSEREVASIAFVQVFGLVPDDEHPEMPVETRVFTDDEASMDEDLRWVQGCLLEQHGGGSLVTYATYLDVMVASSDIPSIVPDKKLIWHVTTDSGPGWGMVVRM